jgi:hypothetical protein
MSDILHFFRDCSGKLTAVSLPFELDEIIAQWSGLINHMARNHNGAFSRDEWAYMIYFLDRHLLEEVYIKTFGLPADGNSGVIHMLMRPRGQVAVWLPNNVSLLGPLVLILLSLSGNPVIIKSGSHSQNLTQVFLDYSSTQLTHGALRNYLSSKVKVETFSRDDPRQKDMAAEAKVRLFFGSDMSAKVIDSLPHPIGSLSFAFVDRKSEIWMEKGAVTADTLAMLIKVMAIYGRFGCTSPQKVVVIDGSPQDAVDLSKRLAEMWPSVIRRDVEPHTASENVKALQSAAALGWQPAIAERNGAVFASGGFDLPPFAGAMALPVISATIQEAVAHLPSNIQTLGYALSSPNDRRWLLELANSGIKRFVPLAQMHHFGPYWDGYSYWSSLFETVEIRI